MTPAVSNTTFEKNYEGQHHCQAKSTLITSNTTFERKEQSSAWSIVLLVATSREQRNGEENPVI